MGSHDFTFGYDWKRDRRKYFRDQPGGDIFYRDLNGAVNERFNRENLAALAFSLAPSPPA